jgi:AcrR family transcriptional regulator
MTAPRLAATRPRPQRRPARPVLPTRRERRKQEVHARILETAIALFDEQDFHATKIADICDRADVAHKTFFNHFASKEHLLGEIAAYVLDDLIAEMTAVRQHAGSTRDRVYELFRRIADRIDEAGVMRAHLVHEVIRVAHDSEVEPEHARKLHDAFRAMIEDGRAAGDVAPDHDPETLTEMLMGALYAVMFNWTNFAGYPLRRRALAAARFLGDAMAATPPATRPKPGKRR